MNLIKYCVSIFQSAANIYMVSGDIVISFPKWNVQKRTAYVKTGTYKEYIISDDILSCNQIFKFETYFDKYYNGISLTNIFCINLAIIF